LQIFFTEVLDFIELSMSFAPARARGTAEAAVYL
jgi:hypothetical protein